MKKTIRYLSLPLALYFGNTIFLKKSNSNHVNTNENYFEFGVHMIPHPKKLSKGGEDAFYAEENLLAVADGVGGWGDLGVDPGLYSKELCINIGKLWIKNRNFYEKDPKKLLIEASKLSSKMGSSTCCIMNLDKINPNLYTALIGDSGYLILKEINTNNFVITHESPEHTRSFNFPYQIGTNGDDPNISLKFNHTVSNNDYIILGTDGLFDNVEKQEIIRIFNEYHVKSLQNKTNISASDLSKIIAEKAFELSLNRYIDSPFSKKAKEQGLSFKGGKSDDITVIVAKMKIK